MSTKAKPGDIVTVHYAGRLTSSELFTSSGKRPRRRALEEIEITAGFERAVGGTQADGRRSTGVGPEAGGGRRRFELIWEVPLAELPDDLDPCAGARLTVCSHDDERYLVVVREVHDRTLVVDASPPRKGKKLTFEIELLALG